MIKFFNWQQVIAQQTKVLGKETRLRPPLVYCWMTAIIAFLLFHPSSVQIKSWWKIQSKRCCTITESGSIKVPVIHFILTVYFARLLTKFCAKQITVAFSKKQILVTLFQDFATKKYKLICSCPKWYANFGHYKTIFSCTRPIFSEGFRAQNENLIFLKKLYNLAPSWIRTITNNYRQFVCQKIVH